MKQNNVWKNPDLIKVLKEDGIAVMPTDTLYGIVGRAQSAKAVNRIYKVRKRAPNKPCIILIPDINEPQKFGIVLTGEQKKEIKNYKEPTSFVFDCPDEELAYLHRGTKTLAFRLPAPEGLRNLLKETGPLIAPSANPEGLSPAENIFQAKKYFGDAIDLYVDGGTRAGSASKVVKLHKDGSVEILRY
ncbi:MAG TPA: L-threonylcarbamoyladenylate synthase [Candidatus Paceibacterota bacterium]|nr:L-threonylcarbamoyladenylate synthase [Candidatus Paceibacterota bacterium]